jgi:putative flippase GtrA
MKLLLQEALRYSAVSACGLLIDIAILFVLVHYFCWWYVAAASVSFSAGLAAGYALCITWVFKYRRVRDPRLEFASFAAIGAVGVAINAAAMIFGVKYLGLQVLMAKCGAAAFTFTWNFTARRQLLFFRHRSY